MTASPDAARVLVVNTGSSSLKYRLVEPETGAVLARGLVERIGDGGRLEHRCDGESYEQDGPFGDHAAALAAVRDAFAEHGPDLQDAGLAAIGHRVVHGGERFRDPVLVDDDVLAAVDDLAVLAPLHNPANATGIRVARDTLPDVPHVAVFDTAFHATIPAAGGDVRGAPASGGATTPSGGTGSTGRRTPT